MADTEIFETYDDFLEREDKTINGVSQGFAKENPDYKEMNATNKGCWDCFKCKYCQNCNGCEKCVCCAKCDFCTKCNYCENCEECEECSWCENCEWLSCMSMIK